MAIVLGVHNIKPGSGTFDAITLTPAAGSAMVLAWTGAAATITFSDDKGGVYTTTNLGGGSQDLAIGYALNIAGGSTTFRFDSTASSGYDFWAFELIGVATSAAGDGTNDQLDSTDPHHCGSLLTTGNGVVIGVLTAGGSSSSFTISGGWLSIDADTSAAIGTGGIAIYQVTTAGTWNPTVTTSLGSVFLQGMSLALLAAPTAAARRFLLVRR